MNIKLFIKILMILFIAVSGVALALMILIPPEIIMADSDSGEKVVTYPLPNEAAAQSEKETIQEETVNSQTLARMFYRSAPQKPVEQEEIIQQPAAINYDDSRFSYLGIASTDNTQKYLLKDNQLDFIFPIAQGTSAHNLSITELNLQEQYMLLSDGEEHYRVRLK